MTAVVVYGFTGQYSGPSEYDWTHPHVGDTHKCMLFLRQPEDLDAYPDAEIECRRYGFTEIQFSGCGKLQIDVLNTDAYRGFAGFYEEALSHGSALVYYPNKAAQ
jgi:hypothetical protein